MVLNKRLLGIVNELGKEKLTHVFEVGQIAFSEKEYYTIGIYAGRPALWSAWYVEEDKRPGQSYAPPSDEAYYGFTPNYPGRYMGD